MKKQMIRWVLGFIAFAMISIGGMTAQAATSTVKIGGVSVERSFLNIGTYYQAKRAAKATVTYYKTSKPDTQYTKVITLPKGTIMSGWIIPKHKLARGQWGNELSLVGGNLNYGLVNVGAKKGYLVSGVVSYALKKFKKVKTPAYMPTYSYGDLYLGGAKATRESDSQVKQIVRITSNGYVELIHQNKRTNSDGAFGGKPSSQAKIVKTKVKGATRYLYLNTKMKGVKTTRVGKKGAYQYRLALKNLHQPQNLSGYDDDRGEIYVFDSLYAVGGVTYYTLICNGSDIED